jgi:regulator of protease activity HflC (stomatin/prohibitin superfamily)
MSFWATITNFLMNMPFWAIVEPDEGAVFLRGGKLHKTLTTGFYFKWPLYDRVRKIPCKEQVIDLKNQVVTTNDGTTVATSGAVKYRVDDAKQAILEVYDWDVSLRTLAISVIAERISKTAYTDLQIDDVEQDVQDSLEVESAGWGLEILSVWLTDFAQCKVYRIMTDEAAAPVIVED